MKHVAEIQYTHVLDEINKSHFGILDTGHKSLDEESHTYTHTYTHTYIHTYREREKERERERRE